MTEHELKNLMCEIGRRVWQRNYVAANDGNFSCRLDADRILATPTSMSKGFLKPTDLTVVSLRSGEQLEGERRVTSEIKAHLQIYRHRADVEAVVHAHPPHATAFAVTRQELPRCVLQEVELFVGPIPMAPYARTGSKEFAESLTPYIQRGVWALLLASHGAITLGRDLLHAYNNMETLENYCMVLILARQLGDWSEIDHDAMRDLLRLKERYGIEDPRAQDGYVNVCEPGLPTVQPRPAGASSPPPAAAGDVNATTLTPLDIDGIIQSVMKSKGLK